MTQKRPLLEVIEALDATGQEVVRRVPEEGSGEIVLGSQCIVRDSQAAIFVRDGRALDTLGPGRHTLTTLNLPFLTTALKLPFGSKSPFRAEVIFVSLKEFLDQPWFTPQPIPFRDADLGMVRLDAQGKFSFRVEKAQHFVTQIVGTQGLYRTSDILGYVQSILASRFATLLGAAETSVLDLPGHYATLAAALHAQAAPDFEALGLRLRAVYLTTIGIPPEVARAMDERASMGAIGNMHAYLQFKAARAVGDIAAQPGADAARLGVELGTGAALGTMMAQVIAQAMPRPALPAPASPDPLADHFAAAERLIAQQASLSDADKQLASAALRRIRETLTSPSSRLDDLKRVRDGVTGRFPWMAEPLLTLLQSPAALQALGQMALRSL